MVFVSEPTAMSRVSADLFGVTLGKANIREGTIDAALAVGDWPRDLDLLIVDLGGAADPVADAAALKTTVPGGCIVIGVGRINDVALYRDLMAVGFNDYLAMPFAEGAMGRAVERTLELRDRTGGAMAANPGAEGRQAADAVGHRRARRRRHHDRRRHDRRHAGQRASRKRCC